MRACDWQPVESINDRHDFHRYALDAGGTRTRISVAATTSSPATTYSPVEVLPVKSLNHPTANGASQPDKFPIELMSAMPPAAAVPASSVVGICQKGAKALSTPVTPIIRAAKARNGKFSKTPIRISPAAAARHESAQ